MDNKLSKTLVKLIDHIRLNFSDDFDQCCKELNLDQTISTVSEFYILGYIGENPNINGTVISKKFNITKGGVSKIISRFKDRDLVIEQTKPNNQKEKYYSLTEHGNEIFNEILKHKEKQSIDAANFVNSFTEDEQIVIDRFLTGIQKFIK